MTARSHGVFSFMNDASPPLRLLVAAGLVAALALGIASLWTGDWLQAGACLSIWGAQILILAAVQRGSPPSAWEKAGAAFLSTLALLLCTAALLRRFTS